MDFSLKIAADTDFFPTHTDALFALYSIPYAEEHSQDFQLIIDCVISSRPRN